MTRQFDKLDRGTAGNAWGSARRAAAARTGVSMPNGDFPIEDRADVEAAVEASGRHADPEAARQHITGRALSIGATDLLPSHWPNSTRPAEAPEVGAGSKHPFVESAAKIQHRLTLAKGTPESLAKPELIPQIEADTRKLAGDIGAVEAFKRVFRAPPRSMISKGM